jgi:putative restriction endonuclease
MPRVPSSQLVSAVVNAIFESGSTGQIISHETVNPRRFLVSSPEGQTFRLSAYIWTLTFGGRANLPNEYRIQVTSVASPFQIFTDGPTVLMGYDPELRLFAGFDLERHREFTTGSPSIQIDRTELARAETDGLSFDRKSNDEIAVGIRPDMFWAYCLNAAPLHRYGREAGILRLLNRATELVTPTDDEIAPLTTPRRRVVQEVSRLTRLASFRQQVLFAYGNRCAVTRIQLRLVDAAHILPVGAENSADHVRNGIALAPTYHRAFDAGLIFLDEQNRMRINEPKLNELRQQNLALGIDVFRAPLDRTIFLPPDPNQRPSAEFIRLGNRFRRIAT